MRGNLRSKGEDEAGAARLFSLSSRRSSAKGIAVLVLFAACFFVIAGFGIATAQGENESVGLLVPPPAPSAEELEALQATNGFGVNTNPGAAEEMRRSNLDRAEAIELMSAVFPSALEEPAGIFDGLKVEQFHSDHVAVVVPNSPGEDPALLSSLLPLRAKDDNGNKVPVDLELERAGSDLEPANPLVEVGIPDTLGEGIELPDAGLEITLKGAATRSASTVDGAAAFYPNVATDTDLAVVPTPTGVETLTQLRSSDAPNTQTFDLTVPPGAALEGTSDGGAVMSANGEPTLLVHAPTAIDAAGRSVPVSLDVEGDAISLQVKPPADVSYPILVDPVYDRYYWMAWNKNWGIWNDWTPFSTKESYFKPRDIGNLNGTLYYGLTLKSFAGGPVNPGERATWFYYVPRYAADVQATGVPPSSYIRGMSFTYVYFMIEEGAPVHTHPYALAGLWDESKQTWSSAVSRTGADGPWAAASLTFSNPTEMTNVKSGGLMLATSETSSYPRQLYAGQASVELGDRDLPTFALSPNPSKWFSTSEVEPVNFALSDSGLGAYSMHVKMPSAQGGSIVGDQSVGCTGAASSPCPRTWESHVNFDPTLLPQGENVLELTGKDPVGNTTAAPKLSKVKVDHTAPGLALSGNLTEQATVGTNLTEYTLNYAASDGDDAAASATTPIGSAGTGAGQLERPSGVAVDQSGNVWTADTANNRVVEYDKNGSFVRQVGTAGAGPGQFNGPRGIAIAPDGTVWVADYSNARLEAFTPQGAFVREVKTELKGPFALAVAQDGSVWVSDIISYKLRHYSATGAYLGTAPDSLKTVDGLAIDSFGNIWASEYESNKIYEFDSTGHLKFSFGGEGTGNGQFKGILYLAVAPSGNVLVVDSSNNRVQEFKPDGTYLRQFGSLGAGAGQLTEPRGIAAGPGNTVYVGDPGNHRIAKWDHADQDPQSGAAKVEVKLDGTTVKTQAPGCTTKSCQVAGSWTLESDKVAAGGHKLEVVATDAVGLVTVRTLNIETHGDLTAPIIALSGSMTEQESLGTTRPSYLLKVEATDPGSSIERKSGVASTSIKVDGVVVDSVAPGCPSEGCSSTREWTLNSNSYSPGKHTVEVKATDAAGHTSTKTLAVTIQRDTTAPQIEATTGFYSAPEGWVEQKPYSYDATATDPTGYGVTSLMLKVDGSTIASATQACSAGGCSESFGSVAINMSDYSGGSHPAELIALDGAGNVRKRSWTINVDPYGTVTASEAVDTLEAVQATTPEIVEGSPLETLVGPETIDTGGEIILSAESGGLQVGGTEAPSEINTEEPGTFSVTTEGVSEDESETEHVNTVEVVPLGAAAGEAGTPVVEDSAAVIPNSGSSVDTLLHPVYDGIMAFSAIRDITAPTEYSWEVNIGPGEYLQSLDSEHIGLFWGDGTEALLISSQPAHGADGESIATTLSLSEGNVITETVHHRVSGVVYPVTAGVGWNGGWQFTPGTVSEPMSEEAHPQDAVQEVGGFVSAPVPYPGEPSDTEGASASDGSEYKYLRKWGFPQCEPDVGIPGGPVAVPGCSIWEERMRGFFWYNYKQAWYGARDPQCLKNGSLGVDANAPYVCAWIPPNHQHYGDGYHITAQMLFSVTYAKFAYTKEHHLTVRAFGSGGVYPHNTACVCNPSVPGQDE